MMNLLNIYQIFYDPTQKSKLDPRLIPFDNSGAKFPYNYEFGVIYKSFATPLAEKELRGFVSWKFAQKTGIDGSKFVKFIEANPGYDVYCINPFPGFSFFRSVWRQGEFYHPGIMQLAQNSMQKAGYELNLSDLVNSPAETIYCNFWVGNSKFWNKFIAFSGPLWNYFENQATDEEKHFYASPADKNSQAPYSAYLFERMFSTFLTHDRLSTDPDKIRSLSYSYSLEELIRKYNFVKALLLWLAFKLNSSKMAFLIGSLRPLISASLNIKRHFKK